MSQVVIENPIINSPFDEPTRHFKFTDEGITNEIVDGRRTSSYFVPIAKPKKKGAKQLQFRHGVDPGPHRGKQARQPHPPPRRAVAQGRLRRRDADHRTLDCLLDRPRPREEALLLPDRSPRNRSSTSPRSPRNTATPGSRTTIREANDTSNPGLPRARLQDGDRLRQDRRHGHAHRLADAQQAAPTRRTPASPTPS